MTTDTPSLPHVDEFRRYAEILLGNKRSAQAWTDATIGGLGLSSTPKITPDRDGKTKFYEYGHRILSGSGNGNMAAFRSDLSKPSLRLIDNLDILERSAVILINIEGFSLESAAHILNTDYQSTRDANDRGSRSFISQLSVTSLVVENEPLIAMDISRTLEDCGVFVKYVAQDHQEAVDFFKESPSDIVLMDIQLNDGFTGIDAAKQILNISNVPLIFVTAYPEKLLTGERPDPTFLITKPFQRSTIRAAITQALLNEYIGTPSNASRGDPKGDIEGLPLSTLEPLHAPLDATVVRQRLHLGPRHQASTQLSDEDIETVRKLHLGTAGRLERMLLGSNCPGIYERISEIKSTLTEHPSSEFSIKLGVQVRGIRSLIPKVSDILEDSYYSDIEVFISDLHEFCNNFKNFRSFIHEALRSEESTTLIEAARDVVQTINRSPSEAVSDELKSELQTINSEDVLNDPVAGFSLLRSVGNIIRSVTRAVIKISTDVAKETGESFRKKIGEALGTSLGTVFIAVVGSTAAYTLATLFPSEFGWILEIVKALMR